MFSLLLSKTKGSIEFFGVPGEENLDVVEVSGGPRSSWW